MQASPSHTWKHFISFHHSPICNFAESRAVLAASPYVTDRRVQSRSHMLPAVVSSPDLSDGCPASSLSLVEPYSASCALGQSWHPRSCILVLCPVILYVHLCPLRKESLASQHTTYLTNRHIVASIISPCPAVMLLLALRSSSVDADSLCQPHL